MSALAKYVLNKGKKVLGYDAVFNERCVELSKLGVHIYTSPNVELDNVDAVVYSDAFSDDFCLVARAKDKNINVISRGDFLFETSKYFKNTIAISGCHGKTTVTALVANVFNVARKNFAMHVGGIDKNLSNFYATGDEYLITEACEFKKNFLALKPTVSVVLNTDVDHLDCYESHEELKKSYLNFLNSAQKRVFLYGDVVCEGTTFGFDKNADYHPKNLVIKDGKCTFVVVEKGRELGIIESPLYGKFNVLNVLATIAVARGENVDFSIVKKGVENFVGIERRFENLGKFNGATVIADYAHHPNEIKEVIRSARKLNFENLFVVFQPHTYSRTRKLFAQFTAVLSHVYNLIIYKTYPAREYYDDAGSALTLSNRIKKSHYASSEQDLSYLLKNAKNGDAIFVLGAGDIYDIFKKLIKN